jgi:hypothetical protein
MNTTPNMSKPSYSQQAMRRFKLGVFKIAFDSVTDSLIEP